MTGILPRIRARLSLIAGEILHNKIEAYWYTKDKNFGDPITPKLLKRYGFTPVNVSPKTAQFFCCGSILEKVPKDFSGFILGTGFMHATSTHSFERARILAVRGELSWKNFGSPEGVVFGGPGLLFVHLTKSKPKKRYMLGLIPHYADKTDPAIFRFFSRYKNQVRLIDVQSEPETVLRQIAECEWVASSSLHGLVFADALGIPNTWLVISERVSGKGFKFYDYFSALGKEQMPFYFSGEENLPALLDVAKTVDSSTVQAVQEKLDLAFRRFQQLDVSNKWCVMNKGIMAL